MCDRKQAFSIIEQRNNLLICHVIHGDEVVVHPVRRNPSVASRTYSLGYRNKVDSIGIGSRGLEGGMLGPRTDDYQSDAR